MRNVQRCPVVETFSIGRDLAVCLADLRSHRSTRKLLPESEFTKIVDWARGLVSPGVFVSPQPLIVERNKVERNLLSFEDQYKRLLQALAYSGHDIVVLSGDVHFGRIATCRLGNNGARLVEIISSPLSNLTYLNGVATSTPKHMPRRFPDPGVLTIDGWTPARVNYSSDFEVDTKKGRLVSAYPKARTKEHFMTVSFHRRRRGGIKVAAQAWQVRSRTGPRNLPAKDFPRAFRATLS